MICLGSDLIVLYSSTIKLDTPIYLKWHNFFYFIACAPSYNSCEYPEYKLLNSQINEQQNSTTKHLTRQLSYMTPENFVNHAKFFLWYKNEEKRNRGLVPCWTLFVMIFYVIRRWNSSNRIIVRVKIILLYRVFVLWLQVFNHPYLQNIDFIFDHLPGIFSYPYVASNSKPASDGAFDLIHYSDEFDLLQSNFILSKFSQCFCWPIILVSMMDLSIISTWLFSHNKAKHSYGSNPYNFDIG